MTEAQTRGRANAFALRVQGTSMIDALIDDGDIVILEPTPSCDDGEMVAVWLRDENETTLKKVLPRGRTRSPAADELGDGPNLHLAGQRPGAGPRPLLVPPLLGRLSRAAARPIAPVPRRAAGSGRSAGGW